MTDSTKEKGTPVDFADLAVGVHHSEVLDARGSTRGDSTHGHLIDGFYVSSGEHISPDILEGLRGAIEEVAKDKRGEAAQAALNGSERYKREVNNLTSETKKEVIAAMAFKESDGKTRINAATLHTEVKEVPITITIIFKDGTHLFWDMPQEKLYKLKSDGNKEEVNPEETERQYNISLPRNKECLLAPNQKALEQGTSMDLDPKNVKQKGKPVDLGMPRLR